MIYKYKNTPFRNKYISRVAIVLIMAILLQGFVVVDSVPGAQATSGLIVTILNNNQVELNWSDLLTDEKGYVVEKRVDSGSFSVLSYTSTNSTIVWDYNLEVGKTYTYRVKATDSSNVTYIYTNEVSVRTNDLALPTSINIKSASFNQIDIKWTYPDQKAFNTIIERRAESESNWIQIARVGVGQTSYSDKSATTGIRYYYRVRAYLTESIRTKAYPESGSSDYSLLYKPTDLYGFALSNIHLQLRWQDNSMETAFIIERKSPDDGVFKQIAVVPQNITTYIDQNDDSPVEPNKTYIYRIKAVNQDEESEYSNLAYVTSEFLRSPEALTSTCVDGTSVVLNWQDQTIGETGFEVWKKIGETGAWELYKILGRNIKTFTDKDVLPENIYSYKLRARMNDNLVYSDYSSETTIWTSSIKGPANLEYKVKGQNEVELTWEDTSNVEAGVVVEKKLGFYGQWYPIANLQPNTTKFNDKWAYSNEINYYRIMVYDGLNATNYSNEIIITTQKPEAPLNLQAHALSSSEVQLIWQDNSYFESEYIIEARQFYIFTEVGRVSSNKTTFIHQATNPDRTYTYRVRAANGEIQSDNSNEATATTLKNVTFTDLDKVKWAVTAIENLASKDVYKEKTNLKFYPDEFVTKGEFCATIIRSLDLKSIVAGRFADVSAKHKYYIEIMSAAKLGIISKDNNNKVYPDKYITREEAGVMLSQALKSRGTPLPEANLSILKQFADYRMIPDKSAENIAAICNANILTGRIINGRNYIQATSNVTRAESAVMVYKALKLD